MESQSFAKRLDYLLYLGFCGHVNEFFTQVYYHPSKNLWVLLQEVYKHQLHELDSLHYIITERSRPYLDIQLEHLVLLQEALKCLL